MLFARPIVKLSIVLEHFAGIKQIQTYRRGFPAILAKEIFYWTQLRYEHDSVSDINNMFGVLWSCRGFCYKYLLVLSAREIYSTDEAQEHEGKLTSPSNAHINWSRYI